MRIYGLILVAHLKSEKNIINPVNVLNFSQKLSLILQMLIVA